MFRTRDFVLFFTMSAFLISAIGATVWTRSHSGVPEIDTEEVFVVTEDTSYSAALAEHNNLSREDKLKAMRQKISAGEGLSIESAESFVVVEDETAEGMTEGIVEESLVVYPDLCPDYSEFTKVWNSQGLLFQEIEGSRLVYREVEKKVIELVATSTFSTSTTLVKETVAQLPVRFTPAPDSSCIGSDVVGIALEGSLIRNNEAGLYGVFEEETLIGYSLDGFPIYGTSSKELDDCGGTGNFGNYRYYLSRDRDVILNCFSAAPVKI